MRIRKQPTGSTTVKYNEPPSFQMMAGRIRERKYNHFLLTSFFFFFFLAEWSSVVSFIRQAIKGFALSCSTSFESEFVVNSFQFYSFLMSNNRVHRQLVSFMAIRISPAASVELNVRNRSLERINWPRSFVSAFKKMNTTDRTTLCTLWIVSGCAMGIHES